jgi:hypothetical protein
MLGAKQEDGMDSEPNLRAVAIVCGFGMAGVCLLIGVNWLPVWAMFVFVCPLAYYHSSVERLIREKRKVSDAPGPP